MGKSSQSKAAPGGRSDESGEGVRSYSRAMRDGLPAGHIWCGNAVAARVVAEHFAVRVAYEPHESGAAGLYMQHAEIDHIPSGRRAGPRDILTFDQAVLFAESLATAPADWGRVEPRQDVPGLREFHASAEFAALRGEKIDYDPWIEDQKRRNAKELAGGGPS